MRPSAERASVCAAAELRGALLCAAFLAGYGNVFNALVWRTVAASASGLRGLVVGATGPLGLLATVFCWHQYLDRRTLEELGLHARGWRSGLAWGALAGTAMAVPPILYFRRPNRAGTAVEFREIRGIGLAALLVRVLFTTPVLVAFVEEVAFRGLLQRKLQRALPTRPLAAITLSSLSFALWHVLVNLRTLQQTNVLSARLAPLPLAVAGGLLSVFAGGLVFGGLQHRTGSLAAPVLTHWLVDALMLLALYAPPPDRPSA